MQHTTPLYRRTPAITGMAALGLVTTVMLAPAAHADTDLDLAEGPASTIVVADVEGAAGTGGAEATVETAPEPVTGTGEEAPAETGEAPAGGTDEALTSGTGEAPTPETGDEPPVGAEAGPADAEPAEGIPAAGPAEQDGLCTDAAAGDQQDAGTGDAAPTDTGTGDATIEAGTDGTDGTTGTDSLVETAAAATGDGDGDGTLTDPGCAATAPDQAGTGPGAPSGDDTQLPVGGVDAGRGEAAGQNVVLPIATAGALAAAVSLGAYTLVRRRRSAA
ncbi:hypothetical protein [Citricoccus sp.]|uniref:hypothetical protein n=1 Tax=Citricoccus sp. TaxID=1978372 RepID=UPI002BF0046C|nr:hypothetical protein [Citricoccus sp.]HRO93190.1 hypothetical protein [Citricoccus sp.]